MECDAAVIDDDKQTRYEVYGANDFIIKGTELVSWWVGGFRKSCVYHSLCGFNWLVVWYNNFFPVGAYSWNPGAL